MKKLMFSLVSSVVLAQAAYAVQPVAVDATANVTTLSEYQRGYEDGKNLCMEDPSACGIDSPVFENGLLGMPMLVLPGIGCFDVRLKLVDFDGERLIFGVDSDSVKDVPGCKRKFPNPVSR